MIEKKPSLAHGAELTPETWADFVARLHRDCVGEGVRDHYTADAVFLVQKRVWQTVPEEISDILRVHTDGCDEPLGEFIDGLEPEELEALDKEVDGSFADADAYEQKEALAKLHPDSTLYHAFEEWETVNQHFTKDAAEAFILRKNHDYRHGLRVYVDASTYSWELNTIKASMLEGRLGLAAGLADALRRLEVSANSVAYCYRLRPENFESALLALEDDAAFARKALGVE